MIGIGLGKSENRKTGKKYGWAISLTWQTNHRGKEKKIHFFTMGKRNQDHIALCKEVYSGFILTLLSFLMMCASVIVIVGSVGGGGCCDGDGYHDDDLMMTRASTMCDLQYVLICGRMGKFPQIEWEKR